LTQSGQSSRSDFRMEKSFSDSPFYVALPIYFVAVWWLFLREDGPLKEWGDANSGLATVLIVFVVPIIIGVILV
jgi:hypothetical protein